MAQKGQHSKELEKLKANLEHYQQRYDSLKLKWSETRKESRYGDEYIEMQMKVYENRIARGKQKIVKLKKENIKSK